MYYCCFTVTSGNKYSIIYWTTFNRMTFKRFNELFANSVDQDQTAQNVQFDLRSTLSIKQVFICRQNNFEITKFGLFTIELKMLFTL